MCAPKFIHLKQWDRQTKRKRNIATAVPSESEWPDQGLQSDDSSDNYSSGSALFACKTFDSFFFFFTNNEKLVDSQFLVFLEKFEKSQALCQHSHLATLGSIWSVAAVLPGVCSRPLATVDLSVTVSYQLLIPISYCFGGLLGSPFFSSQSRLCCWKQWVTLYDWSQTHFEDSCYLPGPYRDFFFLILAPDYVPNEILCVFWNIPRNIPGKIMDKWHFVNWILNSVTDRLIWGF